MGHRTVSRPGDSALKAAVARLRHARPTPPAMTPDPTSAFEVAIAERLKSMQRDLDRLHSRLNWLFCLIIAAALGNVIAAFT